MDNTGTAQQQIENLQREMERLKNVQKNCQHVWGKVVSDPDVEKEFVYTHMGGRGSDPYPEGYYKDKDVPRWSRTCTVCGVKEYTKTLETVEVKKEPKF